MKKTILSLSILILTTSCVKLPNSNEFKTSPKAEISSYNKNKIHKIFIEEKDNQNEIIKKMNKEKVESSFNKMGIPFQIVDKKHLSNVQIKLENKHEVNPSEGINAAFFLLSLGIIPLFGDDEIEVTITKNGKTTKSSEKFSNIAGWITLPLMPFTTSENQYSKNILESTINKSF
ncbi:MAG: hypothetical protein N4A44_05255 [Alphaproteobacteria bacterium]|jgi:hypothetical protein|nr:hypothetical protein [Alphaproteobacteria bacterium]